MKWRSQESRDRARSSSYRIRFVTVYAALFVLAAIVVGSLALSTSSSVRVERVYEVKYATDIPLLVTALGAPTQVVDASQLGGQAGIACKVWQAKTSKSSLIVICP